MASHAHFFGAETRYTVMLHSAAHSMNLDLSQHFADLSERLRTSQSYWRPMAYYAEHLPWMDQHPGLVQELVALSRDQVERLACDDKALTEVLAPHLPFARDLRAAAKVAVLPQQPRRPVAPPFSAGIPGRKWQQVEAFSRCVPVATPVLEWCGGKSHLGFYLQHCSGQAVTSLEWDDTLVAQANARAFKDRMALQSYRVDVLTDAAEPYVRAASQIVALHACGELHERLLQLSVHHQVAEVHVAPCCYHKRQEDEYRPLSEQGREVNLKFNKQELHTTVMETRTASAGVQRQRQWLQIMRLGFDELQRDVRGLSQYLPLPSLPALWARSDFPAFCRHCAQLKEVDLPPAVDWTHYLRRGERRFWRVAALDLVRFLFRRPIEVWLALDRALLLQEHGYDVRLGTFCSTQVTPRNLLLQAWRR